MRTLTKTLMAVALFGFLTSCGGKSACDCAKETAALLEKGMKDPENADKLKAEAESLEKACKKYTAEDFAKCAK
jgi:hypothetical protein